MFIVGLGCAIYTISVFQFLATEPKMSAELSFLEY